MKRYRLEPNSYWDYDNTPKYFVPSCAHVGSCDDNVKEYAQYFYALEGDLEFLKERLVLMGVMDREDKNNWDNNEVIFYTLWLLACDIKDNGIAYLSLI